MTGRLSRLGLLALWLLGCSDVEGAGMDSDAAVDAGPVGYTLIDDGGAALLPNGTIIYLALAARPCPDDSTLDYESFASGFFDSYCRGCHSASSVDRNGAPVGLDYDDRDQIAARAEDIFLFAADGNTFMPEAGPRPSAAERHQLGDWLACGMP